MLGELVDILIDNACKYSARRLSDRRVDSPRSHSYCHRNPGAGGGIKADDSPHVFTPFFRSADTRRDGIAGLGLGLAIAQRLVERIDGKLDRDESSGRRDRFRISFPACAAAVKATASSFLNIGIERRRFVHISESWWKVNSG